MKRRGWIALGTIMSAGALLGVGFFIWLETWQPKPFPRCPDMPGTTQTWRRVTYSAPNGWHISERMSKSRDRIDLFIKPNEKAPPTNWLGIAEDASTKARKFFNQDPANASAVPGTIQRIKIDGKDAVLYLAKSTWQHGQTHTWDLLIDGGDTVIQVSGMETEANPSWNELPVAQEKHCAYWSLVRSLKIR